MAREGHLNCRSAKIRLIRSDAREPSDTKEGSGNVVLMTDLLFQIGVNLTLQVLRIGLETPGNEVPYSLNIRLQRIILEKNA